MVRQALSVSRHHSFTVVKASGMWNSMKASTSMSRRDMQCVLVVHAETGGSAVCWREGHTVKAAASPRSCGCRPEQLFENVFPVARHRHRDGLALEPPGRIDIGARRR